MENLFENRRWLVIPSSITGSIDFSQVVEGSIESLRLSVDKSKTFVKYDILEVTASYTQSYINAETGTTGSYVVEAGVYGRPTIYDPEYPEYNYNEIITLLQTEEWTVPMPSI
jgi:hypothetical protein